MYFLRFHLYTFLDKILRNIQCVVSAVNNYWDGYLGSW